MTMSTYKSLGGPAGGLVVTNDAGIAERLDTIAYPGLTANFDAAKSAALAMTMLDWKEQGAAYARQMVDLSVALAGALHGDGIEVFGHDTAPTESHQFALRAHRWGGGHQASLRLRRANLLACAIGLPDEPVEGEPQRPADRDAGAGAHRHAGVRHAAAGRAGPARPGRVGGR